MDVRRCVSFILNVDLGGKVEVDEKNETPKF